MDTVAHGDEGYGVEGFVNIPIGDRAAVRLVGWHTDEGGWIDNVPGELDYEIGGISRDNLALVEDDWNTAQTSGARALLKIDLNDNWSVTPGIMYQEANRQRHLVRQRALHRRGIRGQLVLSRGQDEDWYQASLTLEGQIGDLNLVYAGALPRPQRGKPVRLFRLCGIPRLLSTPSYGYNCLYYDALGGCADPSQYVYGDENFKRSSHEVRLQSGQEDRFRWTAGLFYQRQEHYFDLQWTVPALNPAQSVVEDEDVVWLTNQDRVDRDKAVFGEVYFDLTDTVTLIGGARYFEYENSLYGFNGNHRPLHRFLRRERRLRRGPGQRRSRSFPASTPAFSTTCPKATTGPSRAASSGNVTADKMLYATYSEGFRAGGVNRARVPGIPQYEPDWVYNYELGWKTQWADGAVRFNGAVYLVDWEDFQYGFLDFTISNLTIIQNVGTAQTKGLEFELDWTPAEGLLLSLAGSYNDSSLQEDFWRSADDRDAGLPPDAPDGTEMPYVPQWQYTALGTLRLPDRQPAVVRAGGLVVARRRLERPRGIQRAAREDGFLRRAEPVDRHRERALVAEPLRQQRDRRARPDRHRRPGLFQPERPRLQPQPHPPAQHRPALVAAVLSLPAPACGYKAKYRRKGPERGFFVVSSSAVPEWFHASWSNRARAAAPFNGVLVAWPPAALPLCPVLPGRPPCRCADSP